MTEQISSQYPADKIPSAVEICFNGHNVNCWCILDGGKADINYYLNLSLDPVLVPENLEFVDVFFDGEYVLTVKSDGVATHNTLQYFYRENFKIFHRYQGEFSVELPDFLLDWEMNIHNKILWKKYHETAEKVEQGAIPF